MFYQVGKFYHCTNVLGSVAQYSAESDYTAACNTGIFLLHFRIINNNFLNKYLGLFQEQAPLLILAGKSAVCVVNNGKDNKHTRKIARIMHFVINGEEYNLHNTVWC